MLLETIDFGIGWVKQKQASGLIMHAVLLEARTGYVYAHMCLAFVFLISGCMT